MKLDKPAQFISDAGYGKGSNFTVHTVANLMYEYAEVIKEETIGKVKEELLKQTFLMSHNNSYPSEAVPKATILELEALLKSGF